MPYQTGTASDPGDLLAKWMTFAAANGWTLGSPSSGAVVQRNGIVCGLFATATEIRMRGATAASGGAWDAQVNNAGNTAICNLHAGPFPAYHFYSDVELGRYRLACTVEITAGIYRHLLVTQLIKAGSYTGGTYIDCTNINTGTTFAPSLNTDNHGYLGDANGSVAHGHVWIDIDGRVNSWSPLVPATNVVVTNACGNIRSNGLGYGAQRIGYVRHNLRTLLQPIWIFQNRSGSKKSPLGMIPATRFVSMGRYSVGQQDNHGGDNFQMWPAVARGNSHADASNGAGLPTSGWYGYAHLRT